MNTKTSKKKTSKKTAPKKKRAYTHHQPVHDVGIPCRHCGNEYGHKILKVYRSANRIREYRRMKCGEKTEGGCGRIFISFRQVNPEK